MKLFEREVMAAPIRRPAEAVCVNCAKLTEEIERKNDEIQRLQGEVNRLTRENEVLATEVQNLNSSRD